MISIKTPRRHRGLHKTQGQAQSPSTYVQLRCLDPIALRRATVQQGTLNRPPLSKQGRMMPLILQGPGKGYSRHQMPASSTTYEANALHLLGSLMMSPGVSCFEFVMPLSLIIRWE
jgi:hypothetical protein